MLVGRASEQRRVEAVVSNARVGQSAVLTLVGEAGVGKTALLDHAAGVAHGLHLLRVTGSEAEHDLPFAGLGRLLRVSPAQLEGLPPPQAQALGVALAIRSGEGVDRFAVGAATLTLLTQLSEDRPIGLLIDDAHLLDRPSQEALSFAARRLLADAVFVLTAARAGEPCALVSADLPQLTLTGLATEATAELVQARLGHSPSRELATRVFDLTEGNALAICELTADPARLHSLSPEIPGPVPARLAELYARRAAALAPVTNTALLLAATIGDDLGLLARVCVRLGVHLDVLGPAERAGLIAIDGEHVRFAHPLIRSAIYSTAAAPDRRVMHAAVAAAMPDTDPDRRAWHRAAAVLGPDEAVAAEVESLGDRAAIRGAFAVAATAYERSARLSTDETQRARRLLAAASAAWNAGDAPRARPLLDETVGLSRAPVATVSARRLVGVIAARSGSLVEARDTLVDAAAQSAELDAAGALRCYAEAINACFYLGDAAGAMSAAQEAEVLLTSGFAGEESILATMAVGMAQVLAGRGGADQLRLGIEMLNEPGRASEMRAEDAAWLVLGPLFLRESGTGRMLVQQAIADRRLQAAVGSLPHLLFHLARDNATTERWVHAEADYSEAIALAREFGQSTELACSLAGLAWLEARQGRREDASAHAAEADALSLEHQIHLGRIWSLHALADLELGLGRAAEAVEIYQRLATLLDQLGVLDVDLSPAPELVEALVRSRRAERAADLSAAYSERALAKGQPWALARAARAEGLLCAPGEIDGRFEGALDLHARTLDRFEEARTRLAYGSRLRRMRRRVDARPQLQLALEMFDRLGARPWADLAADELEATGATAQRAGASLTGQLTARELQIALLLAEGRTTRQAAAAAFLSPKTVEYHLRHVYTKLGVDSRAQLAERLRH